MIRNKSSYRIKAFVLEIQDKFRWSSPIKIHIHHPWHIFRKFPPHCFLALSHSIALPKAPRRVSSVGAGGVTSSSPNPVGGLFDLYNTCKIKISESPRPRPFFLNPPCSASGLLILSDKTMVCITCVCVAMLVVYLICETLFARLVIC